MNEQPNERMGKRANERVNKKGRSIYCTFGVYCMELRVERVVHHFSVHFMRRLIANKDNMLRNTPRDLALLLCTRYIRYSANFARYGEWVCVHSMSPRCCCCCLSILWFWILVHAYTGTLNRSPSPFPSRIDSVGFVLASFFLCALCLQRRQRASSAHVEVFTSIIS